MNKVILAGVLLLAIQSGKCGQQQAIETEHLRLVPTTTLTDKAELDDIAFFKGNGMDGARVTVGGVPAIARHNRNGSWMVEYADGSRVPAQMSNPSKGRFRLTVGGVIASFEQLATVKERK